jgi:hypothetical protein
MFAACAVSATYGAALNIPLAGIGEYRPATNPASDMMSMNPYTTQGNDGKYPSFVIHNGESYSYPNSDQQESPHNADIDAL